MMRQITGRKLTLAYVTALLSIALLTTIDFSVQRAMLRDSEITQRLKDITASQRALVQSIAFNAQSLGISADLNDRENKRYQIREMLGRLDRSLAIMDRDFKNLKSFSYLFSENLSPLYYTESLGLRRELDDFRNHVQILLSTDPLLVNPSNPDLRFITDKAEKQLYNKLDMFVTWTVLDSQKRLDSLGVVDTIAYVFVLILLTVTGFFLFRPVVSSVVEQQITQYEATERLEERAEALEQSRGKLRQQTRILRSVLNTMGDALIVVDESGKILMQNPEAEQWFGVFEDGATAEYWHQTVELKDANGKPFVDINMSPILRTLNQLRLDESLVQIERAGSEPSTLSVTGRAMVDDEGAVQGAVLNFHDVTDRMAKEKELVESKIRAESASISKTQFIANISHEIRTPMSAIIGFADRLLVDEMPTDERFAIVQIIRRNCKALMSIIDDLLDISKIETGQLAVSREWIDTNAVISEVHALLLVKAQEQGIGFDVRFEGWLPAQIYTDATRLRQILINVIGNAIKFTERGMVRVRVMFGEQRENESALIVLVEDTGIGISKESVSRLFKPFGQVDSSTTRRFGGTGLGLNLSRKLARALGGDLDLSHSVPGEGSIFTLTIDPGPVDPSTFVKDMPLANLPERERDHQSLIPSRGLEQLSVLLVDDGEENRDLFSYYLRSAGAKVETAIDGQEGLDRALSQNFDVILLDIQMPKLDGYQTLRALRENCFQGGIVALTAHAMKNSGEEGVNQGFDAYLAKPVEAAMLVKTLQRWMTPKIEPSFEEKMRSIVQKFTEALPGRLTRLEGALSDRQPDVAQQILHQLRGTAGACGFAKLAKECEDVEELVAKDMQSPEIFQKFCGIKQIAAEMSARST